jgi:hypothetical protein
LGGCGGAVWDFVIADRAKADITMRFDSILFRSMIRAVGPRRRDRMR